MVNFLFGGDRIIEAVEFALFVGVFGIGGFVVGGEAGGFAEESVYFFYVGF